MRNSPSQTTMLQEHTQEKGEALNLLTRKSAIMRALEKTISQSKSPIPKSLENFSRFDRFSMMPKNKILSQLKVDKKFLDLTPQPPPKVYESVLQRSPKISFHMPSLIQSPNQSLRMIPLSILSSQKKGIPQSQLQMPANQTSQNIHATPSPNKSVLSPAFSFHNITKSSQELIPFINKSRQSSMNDLSQITATRIPNQTSLIQSQKRINTSKSTFILPQLDSQLQEIREQEYLSSSKNKEKQRALTLEKKGVLDHITHFQGNENKSESTPGKIIQTQSSQQEISSFFNIHRSVSMAVAGFNDFSDFQSVMTDSRQSSPNQKSPKRKQKIQKSLHFEASIDNNESKQVDFESQMGYLMDPEREYPNVNQKKSFIEQLPESLAQLIKSHKELQEASDIYRMNINTSIEIQKKEEEKVSPFIEYLSSLSIYILEVVSGEIPTLEPRDPVIFDSQLGYRIQELLVRSIVDTLRNVGFVDIIQRFEFILSCETQRLFLLPELCDDIKDIDGIVKSVIAQLNKIYSIDLTKDSMVASMLFSDLLSSNDRIKIQAQMSYVRTRLRRDMQGEIGQEIKQKKSPTGNYQKASSKNYEKRDTYRQQDQQSQITNKRENNDINEAQGENDRLVQSEKRQDHLAEKNNNEQQSTPSASNLMRIGSNELFYVKKSIYDSLRSNISLINRAKVMEKVESLRFGYFKEIYGLDSFINAQLVSMMRSYIQSSQQVLNYFKKEDQAKKIGKFLTNLLNSILGDMTLISFLGKSNSYLEQPLDNFLISMLEQGIKGSFQKLQVNVSLSKEIDFKFIHLKRRARMTQRFSATFYQIDQICQAIHRWIEIMDKHKQFSGYGDAFIQQIKKIDMLEYILVCALSDLDTFSISDIVCGLKLNGIGKHAFLFWIRGIRRILIKMKFRQAETTYLESHLQKIAVSAY